MFMVLGGIPDDRANVRCDFESETLALLTKYTERPRTEDIQDCPNVRLFVSSRPVQENLHTINTRSTQYITDSIRRHFQLCTRREGPGQCPFDSVAFISKEVARRWWHAVLLSHADRGPGTCCATYIPGRCDVLSRRVPAVALPALTILQPLVAQNLDQVYKL